MNLDVATSSAEGVLTLLGLRGIGPQAVEKLLGKFGTLGARPRHRHERRPRLAPSASRVGRRVRTRLDHLGGSRASWRPCADGRGRGLPADVA